MHLVRLKPKTKLGLDQLRACMLRPGAKRRLDQGSGWSQGASRWSATSPRKVESFFSPQPAGILNR